MKFSQTTNCFYPEDIQYANLPEDVIEVSNSDFQLAMNRQPGETLSVEEGRVVIVPMPAPTPEALRGMKLAEIRAQAEELINKAKAAASEEEVASWSKQEAEARALIQDAQTVTPLLSAMAQARGLSREELAEKVVQKADAYAATTGVILGTSRALQDQAMQIDLTQPEAVEQLAAVVWP